TALGLAVWYMDDGSIKSRRHRGIFLNTQGFRDDDVGRLQHILMSKFGVASTTRKEKNGKQIYLGAEAGEDFIEIVRPYLIPAMHYKIPKVLI
nr:hypothetical protein [bacterium]NIO20693.1 hypothetical protein [Candidatus Aenigmarchaeota archaeon]